MVKHVLQRFSKEELEDIDVAVVDAVKIVESIMINGLEKTLSTCNNSKKSPTRKGPNSTTQNGSQQ